MDSRVCRLGIYEEAVGVLHNVEEVNGYILASIGPVIVALPASLEAKLRPLIGERIGILRTEKDFRLRIFSVAKIANTAEVALKPVMGEV